MRRFRRMAIQVSNELTSFHPSISFYSQSTNSFISVLLESWEALRLSRLTSTVLPWSGCRVLSEWLLESYHSLGRQNLVLRHCDITDLVLWGWNYLEPWWRGSNLGTWAPMRLWFRRSFQWLVSGEIANPPLQGSTSEHSDRESNPSLLSFAVMRSWGGSSASYSCSHFHSDRPQKNPLPHEL